MSNLRALYTAIAGIDLAFTAEAGGSVTPTVYDLHELPNTAETADLPMRVLLPLEEWGGEGPTFDMISVGTSSVSGLMFWNVVDLMLYDAVGQTRGMLDILADLVRYSAAYVDMLANNRVPTANIQLMNVAIRPGVYEWPIQSGRSYFGVECALVYQELINA